MGSDDDARLLKLAEAVADGAVVDWAKAEADERAPEGRDLVRHLRVLADVADLHRSAAASPLDATAAAARVKRIDRPLGHWGPLQLRAEIGSGASGTVFRAWDPRLDREVALKLLRDQRPVEEGAATTVINEARVLARLRHPNVVTIFGADCFDHQIGLSMEFIDGRTLKVIQKEQGAFSAREATLVGLDLCHALAAVHRAGFVHRDVKAQNVMRETGGRIVLMDFGAAAILRPAAGPEAGWIGTPLYLAPELLQGERPTVSSDLYSLGVLLYYLVSGEFPLAGKSLEELTAAHRQRQYRLLRDLRPDLPSAFVRVIDSAIAASVAHRPASAGAMEALLEASIGLGDMHAVGLTATSESTVESTPRRDRQEPIPVRPAQHFVMTRDGVRIAYAVHGEGPPLVFVRGWVSHLDLTWDQPRFRSFMQCLGRRFTVYRYDGRGNGLSERAIKKITLEALLLDLEALIEHVDSPDFLLYGSAFGGPIAIVYAARHPERVRKLILEGTYARGADITTRVRRMFVLNALRVFPEAAFLLLGYATNPTSDQTDYRRPEQVYQMIAPATAARYYAFGFDVDVSAEASAIQAETLVFHRQESHSVPLRLGKQLADLIPRATFVPTPGMAHNAWEGDAVSSLKALEAFLGVDLASAAASDYML